MKVEGAERAAATAQAGRREALSASLAIHSKVALDDRLDRALLLAVEAYRISPTGEARDSLLLAQQRSPHLRAFLHPPSGEAITAAAVSPDGRTVVTADQGGLAFWDMATARTLPTADRTGSASSRRVTALAFSADSTMLAAGAGDEVAIWDVGARQRIRTLSGFRGFVFALAFNPAAGADLPSLAVGTDDGRVVLLDPLAANDGRAPADPDARPVTPAPVWGLSFSPDGTLLGAASSEGASWWEVKGKPDWTPFPLPLDFRPSGALAFSPGDGRVVVGGKGQVHLFDPKTQKPPDPLEIELETAARAVAFSADGGRIAFGGSGVTVYDLQGKESVFYDVPSRPPGGNEWSELAAGFSPNGATLVSAGRNGAIIWDLAAAGDALDPAFRDQVSAVAFSGTDELVCTGPRGVLGRWRLKDGAPAGARFKSERSPEGVDPRLSGDGTWLLAGDIKGGIFVAGLGAKAADVRQLDPTYTQHLAISHSGRLVAVVDRNGRLAVLNAETLRPRFAAPADAGRAVRAWFDPAESAVAAFNLDGKVQVWSVDGRLLGTVTPDGPVNPGVMAVGPAGGLLAIAGPGPAVSVWEVATGKPVAKLDGHVEPVAALAFSPNGTRLVSAGPDGRVILWDVGTHSFLDQLHAGPPVGSVAFRADGRMLAGVVGSQVYAWQIPDKPSFGERVKRGCRTANRNLTRDEWLKYFVRSEPYRRVCDDLPLPPDPGPGSAGGAW